jgi:hypothetical protein
MRQWNAKAPLSKAVVKDLARELDLDEGFLEKLAEEVLKTWAGRAREAPRKLINPIHLTAIWQNSGGPATIYVFGATDILPIGSDRLRCTRLNRCPMCPLNHFGRWFI